MHYSRGDIVVEARRLCLLEYNAWMTYIEVSKQQS
jgi:hypothetical protein